MQLMEVNALKQKTKIFPSKTVEMILDIKNSELKNTKNGTVIAKIDNIYLSIKDTPKYYKRLSTLVFLLSVFNLTFVWYMLSMVNIKKNNIYCLNSFSRQFKNCDQKEFCDNTHYGVTNVINIEDPNIVNEDVLQELENINTKYLNFFLKNGLIFALQNAKLSKYLEIDSYFTIVISVEYKENYNIFLLFNQFCNRQLIMVQLLVVLLTCFIFGNLFFAYLADLYGRKFVILIGSILQFIGALIFLFTTLWILSSGKPENNTDENSVFKQSFNFDYTSDKEISYYLTSKELNVFDVEDINKNYRDSYNAIFQSYINSNIIRINFNKFKLFIYIGFFLIYVNTSSSKNISLAYLLENSINDTEIYKNYELFYLSLPVSYLLHFILTTLLNNLEIPFLISGCGVLVISLSITFLCFDSPRHHFEFFEYKQITKIFKSILPQEHLEKFYKSDDNPKFKKEINKQNIQCDVVECLCENILFLGYYGRFQKYKRMIQQNKLLEVNRLELLKNLFIIKQLIRNDKFFKDNSLIIVSLSAIIGFIFYLTICKFMFALVYSRNDIFNNLIVNQNIFYLTLTMFISIKTFSFILKFFGYKIILFVCFFMVSLLSLIYELICLQIDLPEDLNIYNFNSIQYELYIKRTSLLVLLYLILILVTGLFSTLYFYLTKLSKTIFRCTFYGFIHIILDITLLVSIAMSQYFYKNFFYISVISAIGFINAYFIEEEIDYSIVRDFRHIELEEN